MICFNYEKIFEKYYKNIYYYSKRIRNYDSDDCAQEISIYVYENLDRFDPSLSSLVTYIIILIRTGYHKFVYDKKKQEEFENSHFNNQIETNEILKEKTTEHIYSYDSFLEQIVDSISEEPKHNTIITVFYAILYNVNEKNYIAIAKNLNMNYIGFLKSVKKIRNIIEEVIIKRDHHY